MAKLIYGDTPSEDHVILCPHADLAARAALLKYAELLHDYASGGEIRVLVRKLDVDDLSDVDECPQSTEFNGIRWCHASEHVQPCNHDQGGRFSHCLRFEQKSLECAKAGLPLPRESATSARIRQVVDEAVKEFVVDQLEAQAAADLGKVSQAQLMLNHRPTMVASLNMLVQVKLNKMLRKEEEAYATALIERALWARGH